MKKSCGSACMGEIFFVILHDFCDKVEGTPLALVVE